MSADARGQAGTPGSSGGAALATVLLVEDEPGLAEALEYSLTRHGYRVLTAADGMRGLELARSGHPDVVVLDIMLPKLDGLEVCRILRAESPIGILMLTARAEEMDRVLGLELGADDYLTKPFSMRELLARVKALVRRAKPAPAADSAAPSSSPTIRIGDIILDETRHEVMRNGTQVKLTPREYALLLFLANNRGVALSREQILQRVWGWDYAGESRTVDVHVRGLRKKLEQDPAHPRHIQTVPGAGYRLD